MSPEVPAHAPRDEGDPMIRAEALAASLAGSGGPGVRAVLLYGSHLLGARPDRHSALDFVVIVSGYGDFYQALHAAGEIHRPVWLFTALARLLPPNVIAYAPGDGSEGIAKCVVVSEEHFARALGPRPPDHFLLGRMVQKVAVVWSADAAAAAHVEALLEAARVDVLRWVGPYLDEPFDADGLGRRLLEVCYRGELRPESRDRSTTIFESQSGHFRETLGPVLEERAEAGVLTRGPYGYRFVTPPGARQRRRWNRHFTRSKVRATLRWFKYVLTFDNWLPYVHRKAERRLGRSIPLTRLERRWPLVFLWPRAIRVLLSRPDREGHE